MEIKKLFNGVYFGKKVLITGHTGFKGSWLSLWLSLMGADITGFSLEPDTEPNHFSLLDIKINSIIGDIRNENLLNDFMNKYRPDIVFHLAAQPLVRRSYKIPLETFATNVIGTANLLEACRAVKSVKAIINITSDKCYENKELQNYGYKENDRLGGYDPYSASKACAELVTEAYRNSFFNVSDYGKTHNILVASCRAGNVIGGGDWSEDRLLPDIVRSASRNETTVIRNPLSVRPWQHVLEPLSGYLLLGQKLLEENKEFARAWNFGPETGDCITVKQLLDYSQPLWNSIKYGAVPEHSDNWHEAHLLNLDCSEAKEKLKWKNVWGLKTALEKTIDWYKSFYKNGNVLTEPEIKDYTAEAEKQGLVWTLH